MIQWLLAFVTTLPGFSACANPEILEFPPLVIENVTILDVRDGARRAGQTVTINNGQITSIVSADHPRPPEFAEDIDMFDGDDADMPSTPPFLRQGNEVETRNTDIAPVTGSGVLKAHVNRQTSAHSFRTEVWYANDARENFNERYIFSFHVQLESGWINDPEYHEVIAQWAQDPDPGDDVRGPTLALRVYKDRMEVVSRWDDRQNTKGPTNDTVYDVGPVDAVKGKWVHWQFVIEWRWQNDGGGILDVYRDGVRVVSQRGPNAFNDTSAPYFKFGIYKAPWKAPPYGALKQRTVYFDDVKVGNAALSSARATSQSFETKPLSSTDNALRIDGSGKFLLPGLAEMHAHLPEPSLGDAYRDRVLFLYLAAGVTTVRNTLGYPEHLKWREQVARHELLGPRIYTSGPPLHGGSVKNALHAGRKARTQHAEGYDFLTLNRGLTRDEFDAIAAAATALDIPFSGRVSSEVGLARTLQAGQATIDHLDGYVPTLVPASARYVAADAAFFDYGVANLADSGRIVELAEQTAVVGTWNVPTQTLIENLLLPLSPDEFAARPEIRYMPAATVTSWRTKKVNVLASPAFDAERAKRFFALRRQLILALHEAGAGLLLGSGAPQIFNVPGFAIHRELAALTAAGLTPREALLTGIHNPAIYFGATHRFGDVGEGLEADLVLLAADPTEDIANIARIEGVVARGRWLSRHFIAEQLKRYAGD